MQKLDTFEFREKVENGTGLSLVDFSATWCGPCKMQAPILEELSEEVDYEIYNVDVDESNEIAGQYNINAVPSLLIFKDGVLKGNLVGFHPKEALKEEMAKFI
ncbi:thioredoxin [uncultured Anaerococcus sp.]|uniref:thioredoxin n=1 Tax=uncultured Anaerococcus sp. TaxID=293428 RepID=UPI002619E142|nr:thioredoxin [uncultured Anaerococcus sp.]